MCFGFFRAQGIATGDSLVEDAGVELAGAASGAGRGLRAASCCCRSTSSSATRFDGRRRDREISTASTSPTGWMGLDIGARDRRRPTPHGSLAPRTVLWNGPMGAFELEPFAAGTRARRRGGRRGAGSHRRRRRRLGRRARGSSASPTGSTGSRPAAAPRSSCSRARSCRGSRRSRRRGGARVSRRARSPIVAANWKMHKTIDEAEALPRRASCRDAAASSDGGRRRLPAFTVARSRRSRSAPGSRVRVAAQNMHEEESGAFTGEISAPMLNELGVDAVVLGHSERRAATSPRPTRRSRARSRRRSPPASSRSSASARPRPSATPARPRACSRARSTRGPRPASSTTRPGGRRDRLRAGLGDRHGPHRDARAGEEAIALHPRGRRRPRRRRRRSGSGSSTAARSSRATRPSCSRREEIDGALVGGASLDPADFLGDLEAAQLTLPGSELSGPLAAASSSSTAGDWRRRARATRSAQADTPFFDSLWETLSAHDALASGEACRPARRADGQLRGRPPQPRRRRRRQAGPGCGSTTRSPTAASSRTRCCSRPVRAARARRAAACT